MVTRAWWHAMASDKESRAYLQARLVVLSRLMFWSFIALLAMMVLLYARYPLIEPKRNHSIYAVAGTGVLILVLIWFGLLSRRTLSMRTLYVIDAFYMGGTGTIFAAAAVLASDLHLSSTANILWSCFVVFLRTIVVPSTGRRTAVVSAITFVPMVIAAVMLSSEQELPADAFVFSVVLIAAVVILLATVGSRLIFGLRQQVSAAMRLGQYTLDSKIGEGGNGAVYRAHHALLRRPTAVKLVRPDKTNAETINRFEREVQHMSLLTHPNSVAVYDYGRSPDGVFYYVMEYLDGIDLQKLVERFGPQPGDRVISILVQICGALAEAHRRGLIHRDIKPANVILCERGDVPDVAKVVDFGLVKEFTSNEGVTSRMVLGTPAYLAPEAITAPGEVGPAADLYALGAVGYFLLTGQCVFVGKTAVDVCVQHTTATPVPPSRRVLTPISAELEQILLRCLAKHPADRPESAGELAQLLRSVPPSGRWSDAEAVTWWAKFTRADEPSSTSQTTTITIDLEQREVEPAQPAVEALN
ncbi:MAG: serine/threonine kinase [Myxococcales bacterium]|nr:serine/threonine kinase [Myxococcales bacterium]